MKAFMVLHRLSQSLFIYGPLFLISALHLKVDGMMKNEDKAMKIQFF